MTANNYPVTDEQIDVALFGLIQEIEVKQVKDFSAEVN